LYYLRVKTRGCDNEEIKLAWKNYLHDDYLWELYSGIKLE